MIHPAFGVERGRPDAMPHSGPEFRVLVLKLLFDGQAGMIRGSRTSLNIFNTKIYLYAPLLKFIILIIFRLESKQIQEE
jgi:hypothetical protein